MLCSVVIPTIGRTSLARAIQSVLEQGLEATEFEVIVVNDSGVPLPPADWMSAPQVTVLMTNRCKVGFACDAGAALARGKYLKFLHDDDYLLPEALRCLVEVAENTNASWVVGGVEVVDKASCLLHEETGNYGENVLALLVSGEIFHVGRSLVRRAEFLQVGGFGPWTGMFEDRDLEWRVALIGKYESTPQQVVCVRVSSVTGSAYDASRLAVQNQIVQDSRAIRERSLSAPGALGKLSASVRDDVFLRGRVCRAYLLSSALNLLSGRFFIFCSRLTCSFRLAGPYAMIPGFWRGMIYSMSSR